MAQARVELSVSIPQTFVDRPIRPAEIRDFARRAEALGFASLWTVEQILGAIPILDPVDVLTYAAAYTERIRLGAAVLLPTLRSPVHLAKSLATIDQLSGGRLIVGVGLGGNTRIYPAFGISPARRAARFAEAIRLMKALWTERRVRFDGEFWRLDDAAMEPKPVQSPHPPLWFGGHHPNALRRAVELGDGFVGAGSASTARFADQVKLLGPMLDAAGRDPSRYPIGKRVYLAVDRDRDRAGRRLAEWFDAFYGRPEMAAEVSVWGSVDECLDRLGEVVAAGARFLILNPVFDEADHLEVFAGELAHRL